mgnify:CR=1 FL=1
MTGVQTCALPIFETCNIRLEFLASLSELDEQQIFEKEQIEIDLAKQEVKKAWLLQKQAEIS